MNVLHSVLLRQLSKLELSRDRAPQDLATWQQFLDGISNALDAAHEKLAEQRDKLQAVITAIPDGLCVIDRDQRIAFINPAGAKMLGGTPEQVIGKKAPELAEPSTPKSRRSPETDAALSIQRALRNGESTSCHDATFRRFDGTTFSVAFGVTPVEGGHSLGAVLLFSDISERRHLEITLRHAQKLESIGRLAAGVAHEINTPIQFIGDNSRFLGDTFTEVGKLISVLHGLIEEQGSEEMRTAAAEAMEDADAEYVLKEGPRAIANTLDGVQRVATIVHAMKSLAHQDRGERSLADLNGAINNTLTVARCEYKYVADVVTNFGKIPPVWCYLNDVNQVIINLLVNAAHAVADKVAGTRDRGVIEISTREEEGAVLVSLRDSGTGIPEEVRSKIFEPFFTTKEVGKGTGQGLALARAIIVDKHKGSLWFETEVGKGTTFHIRLPVANHGMATQDIEAVGAAPSEQSTRYFA